MAPVRRFVDGRIGIGGGVVVDHHCIYADQPRIVERVVEPRVVKQMVEQPHRTLSGDCGLSRRFVNDHVFPYHHDSVDCYRHYVDQLRVVERVVEPRVVEHMVEKPRKIVGGAERAVVEPRRVEHSVGQQQRIVVRDVGFSAGTGGDHILRSNMKVVDHHRLCVEQPRCMERVLEREVAQPRVVRVFRDESPRLIHEENLEVVRSLVDSDDRDPAVIREHGVVRDDGSPRTQVRASSSCRHGGASPVNVAQSVGVEGAAVEDSQEELSVDEFAAHVKRCQLQTWSYDHYMHGIVEESGEVYDAVHAVGKDDRLKETGEFSGLHVPDASHVISEIGDVLWYFTSFSLELGKSMSMPERWPEGDDGVAEPEVQLLAAVSRLSGRVSKCMRGDKPLEEFCPAMSKHRDTILSLCAQIAAQHGSTLEACTLANVRKLKGRFDRGTVRGDGEDR